MHQGRAGQAGIDRDMLVWGRFIISASENSTEGKQEEQKLMREDHAFPPHSEGGEASDVHLFCRQRSSVAAMLKELWAFSNHFRLPGDETPADPRLSSMHMPEEARSSSGHEVS